VKEELVTDFNYVAGITTELTNQIKEVLYLLSVREEGVSDRSVSNFVYTRV
jgi:hypothetical protein